MAKNDHFNNSQKTNRHSKRQREEMRSRLTAAKIMHLITHIDGVWEATNRMKDVLEAALYLNTGDLSIQVSKLGRRLRKLVYQICIDFSQESQQMHQISYADEVKP